MTMHLETGGDGNPYDVSRLPRLRQMISKTLKGEIAGPAMALKSRDKVKKRERVFQRSDAITLEYDGSEIYHRSSRSHPRPSRPALWISARSLSEIQRL